MVFYIIITDFTYNYQLEILSDPEDNHKVVHQLTESKTEENIIVTSVSHESLDFDVHISVIKMITPYTVYFKF